MIRRLLVANRGEIARRVIRTCRDVGISPVAVYSDPDADAPHVAEADLAVRLPGAAPADTYLRADLIVDAAARTGADAVHPGYGFLSENADFAHAVGAAGLIWVGPPPDAIAAMGSKAEAKQRMVAAGVPVLPSWLPSTVPADARYPLLVKAAYGGGGRGMRVVADPGELDGAVAAAGWEAASAFGDGTVFVESYLEGARHVEVQVIGDAHGTVVALGERECSIQRRHQKIIEEAPSAAVEEGLRGALGSAAVAAMREIGYLGAGTVEFLVSSAGEFFFLEVNTRLQVEHPVTECVLGLDLVALQLAVAEGRRLPFEESPEPAGHAIEARLYAEEPAADWRPSTGTLHRFAVPGVDAEFAVPPGRSGLRLDAGVVDGTTTSAHYDPMLAKVIARAPTRDEAARRLAAALAGAELHGVRTNRDLLVRTLRHPEFLAGKTDTGFLDRHREALVAPLADRTAVADAALAAALAAAADRHRSAAVLGSLPAGWRNNSSQPATAAFDGPDGPLEVAYRPAPEGVEVVLATPDRVDLVRDGVRRSWRVHRVAGTSYLDGLDAAVELTDVDPLPEPVALLPAGSLAAPMPGSVQRIAVAEGDEVAAGAVVLTIEAMKMQHEIVAPAAGRVARLHVAAGSTVDAGAVLAVIESGDTP